MLLLPVAALIRLSAWTDWRVVTAGAATASLIAYLAIRSDKRRAERGKWRISESFLHLTELVGGWPGSFIGQRQFRHKTSKTRYQIFFWLIVLVHQLLALDLLLGFRFIKGVLP